MSAFTLGQLAAVAGKHPRSMRRWFDSGFFGDAALRTPGGQRQVRGSSAEKVVAEARKRAQGHERKRGANAERVVSSAFRSMRQLERQMRRIAKPFRLDRQTRAAGNLLCRVAAVLLDTPDDELKENGLPPEPVKELVWRTSISPESARAVLVTALAAWMKSVDSSNPTHVAAAIGISRRTLHRRLGQYLPMAKARAELVVDAILDPGYDHKSKKWQPADLSGAKSREERTTWGSMCNYKMNYTKPPRIDPSHDDEGD